MSIGPTGIFRFDTRQLSEQPAVSRRGRHYWHLSHVTISQEVYSQIS